MILQNMDEAAEIKPTVCIEGKQLELLKIETASVGQSFEIYARAKIVGINQNVLENGEAENRMVLELEGIQLEAEQPDAHQRVANFYSQSATGDAQ